MLVLQTCLQCASKPSQLQPLPTLQDGTQATEKNHNQVLPESRYRLDPRLGRAATMTVTATTSCRENRMHALPAALPARSARRERPDDTQQQNSHRLQSTRRLCKEPNKREGPTSRERRQQITKAASYLRIKQAQTPGDLGGENAPTGPSLLNMLQLQ